MPAGKRSVSPAGSGASRLLYVLLPFSLGPSDSRGALLSATDSALCELFPRAGGGVTSAGPAADLRPQPRPTIKPERTAIVMNVFIFLSSRLGSPACRNVRLLQRSTPLPPLCCSTSDLVHRFHEPEVVADPIPKAQALFQT